MSLLLQRLFNVIGKVNLKQNLLLSTNLALLIFPLAITPALSSKSPLIEQVVYKSEIKLATDKETVIASPKKISVIQPGESKVEKEAREKAEAEAKALALARAKTKRNVVARENRTYNDPSSFDEIYLRAQNTYGIDARLLRAIHQVETGGSGSTGLTNRTGSGAQGPMQFLPSTFRRHGTDGNGDGIADINNVEDAIFSAAKYMVACGYPNVQKALWGYNPSNPYYNKVMGIAKSYGY